MKQKTLEKYSERFDNGESEIGNPDTWGKRMVVEPKQDTLNHIVYNIGDSIRIINPTENQPKLFTTHKVDNDFGVVYYYQLDGKEESIGFSYIKKEEPKQESFVEKMIPLQLKYNLAMLDVMKQETLEEVKDLSYYKTNAEEDYLSVPISVLRYISQLEQQVERMYSEEDMKEAYKYGRIYDMTSFEEWFEQFKKKQDE